MNTVNTNWTTGRDLGIKSIKMLSYEAHTVSVHFSNIISLAREKYNIDGLCRIKCIQSLDWNGQPRSSHSLEP